jgi:hypothetical protein
MPLLAVTSFALLPLAAGAAAAAGAERGAFTLEQVLSAPFPSDLAAAPTGGAVAWVFDARAYQAWRQNTSYSALVARPHQRADQDGLAQAQRAQREVQPRR